MELLQVAQHADDLDRATDEWHAFINDSEGNLVGLVSQEEPQS
jgi:hypothetical protein